MFSCCRHRVANSRAGIIGEGPRLYRWTFITTHGGSRSAELEGRHARGPCRHRAGRTACQSQARRSPAPRWEAVRGIGREAVAMNGLGTSISPCVPTCHDHSGPRPWGVLDEKTSRALEIRRHHAPGRQLPSAPISSPARGGVIAGSSLPGMTPNSVVVACSSSYGQQRPGAGHGRVRG